MNKLEVEFVRNSVGKIDVNATLAAWSNDLAVFASKEEADLDVIAQAVMRVWDENQGLKNMNLEAIASFAIRHIPTVAPQAFGEVSERIKDYVRSATDLFCLTKGKNGGVQLLERLTDAERTKVIAQRDKAAEKASEKASAKAA